MTLEPRHIVAAALLHLVLFVMLFTGVQCSQHIPPTPVIQGVLINPSQLQQIKPPVKNPAQTKPEEADQGPQQQVKSDVVADQAKQQQEKAAAQAKQQEEQKAQQAAAKAAEEQHQKDEQAKAKAEELRQVQEAQRQAAEQAAAQKKQQEEAKRKADAEAAAAAEAQHKKDMEAQLRKEAQEQQEAQQAMLNQKKKAEEAREAADRRKRQQELQAALGAESAQLNATIQSQWAQQLVSALYNVWARPPATDSNLKAFLMISLAPNGQVQNASVDTSSGVPAFDDSVVRAAYAASPMPLPADPSAFRSKVEVCFSPNPRNCQ